MAIDREAAKKAGYTDAEIDAFEVKSSKEEEKTPAGEYVPQAPMPAGTIPEIDRTKSTTMATTMGIGNFLADNAAAIGSALVGIPLAKKAINAYANRPVAPTGFSGGGIPTNMIQGQGRILTPPAAGSMPPVVGAPQTVGIGQDIAAAMPKGLNAGQALGYSAILPSALSLPYMGAAMEQSKIRENPIAPEYANNPYAMMTRGEAPTQGAAGAMNTRQALMNQQYGGLSEAERNILNDDRIQQAIRLKAMSKIR